MTTPGVAATHGLPAQRNEIAWIDLGERIVEALTSLRDVERQRPSQSLREKIKGVQEAQGEFERLEAAGAPYLSFLGQWLAVRLTDPTTNEQRKRAHGYSLVLDYTRAY